MTVADRIVFCEGKQTRYKLTERSFNNLRYEKSIPNDILDKLEPLKRQEILSEREFFNDIKTQIGEEITKYQAAILQHADKYNSLDPQLLKNIVVGITGDPVTIVPTGGKFTFSIFAEGYFYYRSGVAANRRYIIFRDRDFDIAPTAEIRLLRLDKPSVFLTHRTCIENYLLDAHLIHTYWEAKYQEKIDNPHSKWGHGNSPGIETISRWIEESAYALKDYQSVRWALSDLIQTDEAHIQLKTTWMGESGKLPLSLSLSDCSSKAMELIEKFRRSVDVITIEKFELSLDKYRNLFAHSDFWKQKQYLIWFQGKDIKKEMQRQKQNYISLEDFFDSVINNQFNFTKYPDLVELRAKIEQL